MEAIRTKERKGEIRIKTADIKATYEILKSMAKTMEDDSEDSPYNN